MGVPIPFFNKDLKPGRDEAVLVCMGGVFQILSALYINEFRPCHVDLKEGRSNFGFLVGVIRYFK